MGTQKGKVPEISLLPNFVSWCYLLKVNIWYLGAQEPTISILRAQPFQGNILPDTLGGGAPISHFSHSHQVSKYESWCMVYALTTKIWILGLPLFCHRTSPPILGIHSRDFPRDFPESFTATPAL